MDYDLGADAVELRDRLRQLITAHIPHGFLGACTDDPQDLATTESFCKLLASEGLLALAWPEEHGGGGGSIWQQTVLREEMWAHHEPRGPQYMGVNWVGPALMRYGTPEQKARHLSAIAAGEVIWCQGFSEPEAGSDLASLRTRAVPDGDGWRITGQKVWTSYAQMASWCVLAACTDPDAPKPQRLTLFLIPMDRAGITVRPIRSMLGPHHLNEVFLDGMPAAPDDVLGTVGDGWQIMREALAFERVGIARYARCESLLDRMRADLGDDWDRLPESLRVRWVRALVDLRVARLLAYRAVSLQETRRRVRQPVPPASQPPPAISGWPSCCSRCWGRPRWTAVPRRRCRVPSRTTGVTRKRPPSRPEPSRCSGCWWHVKSWVVGGENLCRRISPTSPESREAVRAAGRPASRPAGRD